MLSNGVISDIFSFKAEHIAPKLWHQQIMSLAFFRLNNKQQQQQKQQKKKKKGWRTGKK